MVFYNLQRYAVGDIKSYLFIVSDTPWSPPVPFAVLTLLAAVGYFGVVWCLFRRENDTSRIIRPRP